MAPTTTLTNIIRTSRGLTIAGTRITLYDVMDYVTPGWPPKLIRDRLNLTEEQIDGALAYIDAHRAEVEDEYQQVLREAAENRQYWEARNRERLAKLATQRSGTDHPELRRKLREEKARLGIE
jgi:uncharacterized protein (DUF433 family)